MPDFFQEASGFAEKVPRSHSSIAVITRRGFSAHTDDGWLLHL